MSIISSFTASLVSQLIKEGLLTQPSLHCSRQIFTVPIWLVTQRWKFVFHSVFSKCSTFLGVCGLGLVDPGEFYCVFWDMTAPMARPCTGQWGVHHELKGWFWWSIALVCTQIQERSKWIFFLWVMHYFFRDFFSPTFQAVLCEFWKEFSPYVIFLWGLHWSLSSFSSNTMVPLPCFCLLCSFWFSFYVNFE